MVNASIGVIGFGIIAMLLLPWLAGHFNLPESYLGLASVIGVGNGNQALYAAYAGGYEAGRYALWYDIGRHVVMPAGFLYVFIVMSVGKLRHRLNPKVMATKGIDRFPIWLGVFIFAWIVACLHVFKEPARAAIFDMVQWDFSLAAAALGLSLSFRDITAAGIKGFALIAVTGVLRIAFLLAVLALCLKAGFISP